MRLALLALTALILAACSPKPGVQACLVPAPRLFAPDAEASHRDFPLPVITYTEGDMPKGNLGFSIPLDIAADGHIECYHAPDVHDFMTPRRKVAIDALARQHYRPFVRDGRAIPVTVMLPVYEQRLPARHVPPPDGAPDTFSISLSRGGCFGTCPAYEVTVHGDGRATYDGRIYTLISGHYETHVSPQDMERLRQAVADADVWSLDDSYRASITDNAPYGLTVSLGGRTRTIDDYVGPSVGMPQAVRQLEDLVDEVSGGRSFARGDAMTAQRLATANYDFTSREASEALAELSGKAPASAIAVFLDHGADPVTALSGAARAGRAGLAAAVLSRMKPLDQTALCELQADAARSGNPSLFMTVSGRLSAPCRDGYALAAAVSGNDDRVDSLTGQVCPVKDEPCFTPDRKAIIAWLLAHGADVHAVGQDNLFVYVHLHDLHTRQLFLDHGFNLNRREPDGSYVLLDESGEDEALFDLEHGADPHLKDSNGQDFATRARDIAWWRAQAWLWLHRGQKT